MKTPINIVQELIAQVDSADGGTLPLLQDRALELVRQTLGEDSIHFEKLSEIRFVPYDFFGDEPTRDERMKAYLHGQADLKRRLEAVREDLVAHGFSDEAAGAAPTPLSNLRLLADRFHAVARQLQKRHGGRDTLRVNDEHDVQDLLHGLLRLFFDDVRVEDYVPEYAGGRSRVDFLLKPERIVIETKMTRPGLDAKKLGEELIVDQKRYSQHPHCDTLVCFVYDPEQTLQNAVGLELDLAQDEGPQTVVMIRPR